MEQHTASVAPFYQGWRLTNEQLAGLVATASPEQLDLRATPAQWPIWAIVSHLAGARVYWLCAILGEPGADTTPFPKGDGEGWEDDLDHVRGAHELADALTSSWDIVEGCLRRWTPPMLQEEFRRQRRDQVQFHSRQSVLMRLITHDAYHSGEISQILGMHGLQELDLWSGLSRVDPG